MVTLPFMAQSSAPARDKLGRKTYQHGVVITESRHGMGLIVKIERTPGQWTLATFMHGTGPISIDLGQGWTLDNADDIRAWLRTNGVAQ